MSQESEHPLGALLDKPAIDDDVRDAVSALQQLFRNQSDERLRDVTVWANRVDRPRGVVFLGLALGEALGCSPFCGCAAKQIGDQCEPFLLQKLPWLRRAVVEAQAPTKSQPGLLQLKLQ